MAKQITTAEISELAKEYYCTREAYRAMVEKGPWDGDVCIRFLEARAEYEMAIDFQPTGNRVLVRRLPAQKGVIDTSAHDEKAGGGMILVEGEILAVGPGHYDDDGDFVPTTVRPGQRVIFNARWNDFTAGELVGSDCDGKGPLERPMPQWQWDKRDLHLITEGDIAGILQ